jgi:ferrochelatase
MSQRAVLLLNLGSPDSPSVPDVRRYLREFLGDERVLDVPAPLRWALLEGIILRTRPKKSAHAYASVWLEGGSPLLVTSGSVRDKLAATLGPDLPVRMAMRYGNPSIPSVLEGLAKDGVTDVLLFPQYPHYAMSSWETVVAKVFAEAAVRTPALRLTCVQPFFADADYIEALLKVADCCSVCSPVQSTCYRAQVMRTTAALARRAGLDPARYSVSFQSRLAGEPWLQPFTDFEFKRLPAAGVKNLLVICPSFVADCLETLEEISVEGRETFMEAGGESFAQIPCPNDHPAFIEFLAGRARQWQAATPAR